VSQEAQGAELFQQNCAVCHGPTGQGRVGATLAKDWPSIRPDLTVRTIIQNGVPGTVMPAWSQAKGGPLSEAEIDALVAYILSWQTGGAPQITPGPTATRRPPIMPPPNVEGNPNNGAILFDENCIVCHGVNGEGRIGATLAKDWPSIRPDLTVKATISDGVPGSQMPAWSQAKGGPLSEEQINDLVAYILTLGEQTSVAQVAPTAAPEPGLSRFWSGWGGVIVFVILLAAIIALALWVQRRRQA
jgi:ubiquinol-cytochrome c reductase cytochrome c subunit